MRLWVLMLLIVFLSSCSNIFDECKDCGQHKSFREKTAKAENETQKSKKETEVISQERTVTDKAPGEGAERFPWCVEGLKQFPLGYQPGGDSVVAAVVGHNYDGQNRLRLEVVTIEGDLQTITITRHSEIWLHEIDPSIGKYTFWHPVLVYSERKGQTYDCWEIELEGRFIPIWGDKDGEENVVIRYLNEKYPY